jgi:hypothetical protein
MADFGESGMDEIDGRGRRDDTLLCRRTGTSSIDGG